MSASDPGGTSAPSADVGTDPRRARVSALRAAWLAGTLDLAVDPRDPGLAVLLRHLRGVAADRCVNPDRGRR